MKRSGKQGYAKSIAEKLEGGVAISAPVRGYVCPVSLTILAPEFRFGHVILKYVPELKKSAAIISKRVKAFTEEVREHSKIERGKTKKGKESIMNRKTCQILLTILLFLVTGLLGEAWAQKAEATAKPMVLKASIQTPANMPFAQILYWWLDEVEKRSGGRIKFERYPGESLAKAAEQLDALESGMADVSLFVTTYTPGKIPLNTLTALPFSLQYAWVNATSYYQLVQEVPEVKAEYTKHNVRLVSGYATGPYYVFSTKPIRTFGDFKGKEDYCHRAGSGIAKSGRSRSAGYRHYGIL